jgi:TonB family protein
VNPLTRWLLLVLAAGALFGADPTLKVSEADARKAATVRVTPDYPPAAVQLRIMGRAELEAIVAEDGGVEEVRPVKGNPLLTKAGAAALKKWHFTPFQEDGKPARALVSIGFDFKL